MKRLANKLAIITGAAQGLGRAMALRFAAEGCALSLCDLNLEGVRETATQAEAEGVEALALRTDVTDRGQVDEMVQTTVDAIGAPDILINNAGVFYNTPFEEMTSEAWQRMLDTNLNSVFLVSQRVIQEWLAEERGGAIVNMSSMSGIIAFTGSAHYCAAKAAVAALSRCLALEFGPAGIRVNALAPGIVRTKLTAHLDTDRELADAWRQRIPVGRFGQPADVANAALFLASDESAYVTGETLLVDGGWVLE